MTTGSTYPLAPQGVFLTVQGEGSMSGVPMIFLRLAGCSVGCAGCDTDYSVASRATLADIMDRVARLHYGPTEWLHITGGEPCDHDLSPLIGAAHRMGLKVALATAGTKPVPEGIDFLSVSPHALDAHWVQRSGDQLNIVPGLNGLRLADLDGIDLSGFSPSRRYITPLDGAVGLPSNVQECVAFVSTRKGWRLGCQAHKAWGVR